MGVGNYYHHSYLKSETFIVDFDWNDDVEYDDIDLMDCNAGMFMDELRKSVADSLPKQFDKYFDCVPDYNKRFERNTGRVFIGSSKTVEVSCLWHENDVVVVVEAIEDVSQSLVHVAEKSVTTTNIRIQKHLLKNTCFELRVRTSGWTSARVSLEDFKNA